MLTGKAKLEALEIEIYDTAAAAGTAAAAAAAAAIREAARSGPVAVIFATGNSQLETLRALTAMTDIPWPAVTGFHMDEYVGISSKHPASFRNYLRTNLTERVSMKKFYEIDGSSTDLDRTLSEYSRLLTEAAPKICLMGIGENGHLAFNDPGEADFSDSRVIRIANLDIACREQQVGEGWFATLSDVPRQAVTLTIPTLLKVPRLILSVPDKRKAEAVRRTVMDPVSTACPATILRTHPGATLYLDATSASQLPENIRVPRQSLQA